MKFAPFLLILAACAPLPVAELLDFPPIVEANLPADIDATEVTRGPNGCYSYIYANSLILVTDANGDQICVP